MHRFALVLVGLAVSSVFAADGDPVFRSDVALVRVDAQVVDRNNRAITGLELEDFVLKENGQAQAIRNFESEEMPVDVILLLDVSGSMRIHVERLATASDRALRELGEDDRVAIMVFDRGSRVRLAFRNSREDVARELEYLLNQETFDGGTDITRALFDAAEYMRREARPEARHAIVILTDDQTERGRDESGVARALAQSDTVLSALIAPDAMRSGRIGAGGGGWPGSGGGGWPGGGMGGPLGGIILGRRGPMGGRYPRPTISMPRTQSAGTSEIARRSGGDSMRVDEASAFETTLARIRQRYALHFNLPEGVKPGEERDITVELSTAARRRYPDAEVRYRRMNQAAGGSDAPVVVSRDRRPRAPSPEAEPKDAEVTPEPSQRPAEPRTGGWRRVDDPHTDKPMEPGPATTVRTEPPQPAPAANRVPAPQASSPEEQPRKGGWRRIGPGEKP
jgi:VWFA-related protein